MRVLVTLAFYRPHWTGLTNVAAGLAEGLAARGHEVTVLAAHHDRSLPREEVVEGVRVVRVPTAGRLSRTMVMPGYPGALARLAAEHDVIHLHTPMAEAALVAAVARRRRVPLVVTHQGDVVMPPGPANQAVQRAMEVTLRATLRSADEVLTLGEDYARGSPFLRSLDRPVGAVHPPVAIPRPRPDEVAAWRAALGLDGRPVVGFAGRFVAEKGFDVLLAAVPAIAAEIPGVHLLFAGETDVAYEDHYARCRPLLAAAAPHLTEIGLLRDRQRLADFYALCDLFVLPSRSDCFAAVQVEALRCGTPVVACDVPGAREVVTRTGMGWLAPPEDPTALAAAVVAALRHPDPPAPTPAAVDRVYAAEAAVDRYEELLGRHVAARARPPSVVDHALAGEADMAYRRRTRWLLDRLDLTDGLRVLDAGCGLGSHLHLLAGTHRLDLIGLDLDADRLRRAGAEVPGAALARAAIARLPLADASVDRVLASEVLEHVPDDAAALAEVRRVLRPGGRLVLSVPHARYPFWWDPTNRTLEALGRPPIRRPGPLVGIWTDHLRLYEPDALAALVAGAGFVVDEVEEQTHHAFPFSHQLVYGIGKPLVERGWLPGGAARAVGRFPAAPDPEAPTGRRSPVVTALAPLRWVDRRNEHLRGDERTFVTIVLAAHRP